MPSASRLRSRFYGDDIQPVELQEPEVEAERIVQKPGSDFDEQNNVSNETPLKLLHEIKDDPTPKGVLPARINGRTIDLNMFEEYILSNSPLSLKTLLRYYNARAIAHIKGYDKMEGKFGRIK